MCDCWRKAAGRDRMVKCSGMVVGFWRRFAAKAFPLRALRGMPIVTSFLTDVSLSGHYLDVSTTHIIHHIRREGMVTYSMTQLLRQGLSKLYKRAAFQDVALLVLICLSGLPSSFFLPPSSDLSHGHGTCVEQTVFGELALGHTLSLCA